MNAVIHSSIKGNLRKNNQDVIFILDKKFFTLYAVFDGVSSIKESRNFILNFKKTLIKNLKAISVRESQDFQEVIYNTHSQIIKTNIGGMSTLSLLIFQKDIEKYNYFNIGDSRIYIFTNRFLEKISKDDTSTLKKNSLTKCLGMQGLTFQDFKLHQIDPSPNFLLCSDGFYSLMENDLKQYFEILNLKSSNKISKKIVDLQKSVTKDDSSFLIVKNEI